MDGRHGVGSRVRLNPRTSELTEYLLPRATNVRRVYVDDSTNPVNFWVGNNNEAMIVNIEPLEQSEGTGFFAPLRG